ncbi:hypothetical protein ABFX02_14G014900 [Erythranthe guttata]
MEAALESEYDVFFADMSKQISLMIMDDDERDESLIAHHPSLNPRVFAQSIYPERSCSKGTGVFIPHSSFPRRRNTYNKQGKLNNKFHPRPSFDHKSKELSHVACNNNNINNYNNNNNNKNNNNNNNM